MAPIAFFLLFAGAAQGLATLPEGAQVALYEYTIRTYGKGPLNPLPADPAPNPLVLKRLIAKKLSSAQPHGYVRIDNFRIVKRSRTNLTLALQFGLDYAKPHAGTHYEGRILFKNRVNGWQVASAHLDRYDDLGLDPKSEIAAYRLAISKCAGNPLVVLPTNTSDRVFRPLERACSRVSREAPDKGQWWSVAISIDHSATSESCADLEIVKAGSETTYPETRVPIRLLRRHGQVSCRELSMASLPVDAEAAMIVDIVGKEDRKVFVNVSQAVRNALRLRGIKADPYDPSKTHDNPNIAFIQIERPIVRWISKNHAFVSVATYSHPKGGDVVYAYGGPYDLQWVDGKLHLKMLRDQWGGE